MIALEIEIIGKYVFSVYPHVLYFEVNPPRTYTNSSPSQELLL